MPEITKATYEEVNTMIDYGISNEFGVDERLEAAVADIQPVYSDESDDWR